MLHQIPPKQGFDSLYTNRMGSKLEVFHSVWGCNNWLKENRRWNKNVLEKLLCLSLIYWKNCLCKIQEFMLQSIIKYIGSNKLRPPNSAIWTKTYSSYQPEIRKWNLTLLNAVYKPVLENSMFWTYWDKYSSFWEDKKKSKGTKVHAVHIKDNPMCSLPSGRKY